MTVGVSNNGVIKFGSRRLLDRIVGNDLPLPFQSRERFIIQPTIS